MANDHTTRRYVTPSELADILRVRVATIRRWAKDGTIPSHKFSGRVLRFDLAAVETALAERARTRGTQ